MSLLQQINRFCDTYGATHKQRQELPSYMVRRLQALINFMKTEAKRGNQQFVENIADGHDKEYMADIKYINENEYSIILGLTQ